MDGLYFLPHVGKFEGVIYEFWYIGGYIATTWINQGGKVSFPLKKFYLNDKRRAGAGCFAPAYHYSLPRWFGFSILKSEILKYVI
jgi:hypothetical protein